jgi:hypothetical protein
MSENTYPVRCLQGFSATHHPQSRPPDSAGIGAPEKRLTPSEKIKQWSVED